MPASGSPSVSWQGVPAQPKKSNTAVIALVVVAGVAVTVVIAAVVAAVFLRKSDSDSASSEPPTPPAQSNVAPVTLLGQLPAIGATNSLTLPSINVSPTDTSDASAAPSAATPVDADASSEPVAPSSSALGRASTSIQRAFSQHESEFAACVTAPSGTRARVTLRVQFDGGARVVRFVESTSDQLSLPLDAQQCMKSVAQRVLASSAVVATVTVRWSFWVQTRSIVGLEGRRD